MNLIKCEDGKLICTNPKVEKIWQTGYIRLYKTEPYMFGTMTHLIFKDGTRKDFIDLKESLNEANKYLQSMAAVV